MSTSITSSLNIKPFCSCHTAYPERSKILDLEVVSRSLNEACRDGHVDKVQKILEEQRTIGRLDYLLKGVRTDIHGNLRKNGECGQ